MICTKEHRYSEKLNVLPEDQGGSGRHKCAGCAYDQGYNFAQNGISKIIFDPTELNDSQAGTGCHKDVNAAFELGYEDGLKDKQNKNNK